MSVIGRVVVAAGSFLGFGAVPASAQQCFDFADVFSTPSTGLSGPTHAFEVFDDGSGPKLYAGGQYPGTNTRLIRRWDGASWSNVAAGNSAAPGTVLALETFDDGSGPQLWAAGSFVQIGGTWANNLGAWDGTTWTTPGVGTNGIVHDLQSFDDGSGPALYVAGEFTQAGGIAASWVARWDGSSWTPVGSVPGVVLDLEVYDPGSGPRLYAAGNFNGFLRVWNGSSWGTVGGGLVGQSNPYWTLEVFDDGSGPSLYVGGTFLLAGSTPAPYLARWDGTAWHSLPAPPDQYVTDLHAHDEGLGQRLFVVTQGTIGGEDYGGIARWDGISWSGLSSGVQGVRALASFDDGVGSRLFLGGDFQQAGGKPSYRVARYGESCTPVTFSVHPKSFTAYYTGSWYDLDVAASGTSPLSYQWRHDGVPLSDGERFDGSQTSQLRILWWDLDDQGAYDCLVTNPAGSLASNAAILTVPLPDSGVPWRPEVVALTPEPIEDPPQGSAYTSLDAPDVASTGEIAFHARIDGNPPGNQGQRSINLRANGVDRVLHRQGDAAPGCEAGVTFGGSVLAGEYDALPGGRVAFQAALQGSSLPDGNEAIYFHDQGTSTLIARSGTAPPGAPAGETWRMFSGPYSSEAGAIAFGARHFQGSNIVGYSAWSWTAAGGLQNLVRTGQMAPGANAAFLDFGGVYRPIASTRGGILAITGRLATSQSALWIGPPGALQLVVLGGDPAPGFGPGDTLDVSDSMMVAENGVAAISAWVLRANGTTTAALYAWSGGALQLLYQRGDPAPPDLPAGLLLQYFEPRAVNGVGDILFHAGMSAPCVCPSQGLFLLRNGVLHTVVTNRADPLPGAPPLYTLAEIYRADLNDSGQVVFVATLHSGSSVSCAFGWSVETGLFSIFPPGAQAEIAPGDHRTSHGSNLADGRRNGIGHGNGLGVGQSTSLDAAGNVLFTSRFPYSSYAHTDAYFRAPFAYLHGAQHGPGVPYCFGDGNGASCPCANPGSTGQGCANSNGIGARLRGLGSVSVSSDDLSFVADGLPAQVGSLLFHGGARLNGGLGVPFENGLKCAGAGIRRLGLEFASSAGEVSWGPGLANQGAWLPGTTRYFQVWYRDVPSPCGHRSNTTNALAVTFTP